jgi:hypothetical protein
MVARRGALTGDLDLDRTLERTAGQRPDGPEAIVSRSWGAAPRAVCLLVDRSGSMTGRAVALAAVAAAAVVDAASDRLRTGVIAFAAEPLVLRDLRSDAPSEGAIDDLLSLRGHGVTDLARALEAAAAQLEHVPPGGRTAILMCCTCSSPPTTPRPPRPPARSPGAAVGGGRRRPTFSGWRPTSRSFWTEPPIGGLRSRSLRKNPRWI